jgi:hypothetical protein
VRSQHPKWKLNLVWSSPAAFYPPAILSKLEIASAANFHSFHFQVPLY